MSRRPAPGAATVAVSAALLASSCASMGVHAPEEIGAAANPIASVFLVGDGGELAAGDSLLDLLAEEVAAAAGALGPGNVATVLLGDNLYPSGLPVGHGLDSPAGAALRLQLAAARAAPTYVVLGNHDWNLHRRGGRARARHQLEEVARWAEEQGATAVVLPGAGCPVPAARDVGSSFRLVFLDTQWWLHRADDSADYCPGSPAEPGSLDRVASELRALVAAAGDRPTVILAHHPLVSGGPHGARFGARQHLLPLTEIHPALAVPLPGLGTLYTLLRSRFTHQDLRSGAYRSLRRWAEDALREHPVLAWAGGHEHGLQVIEGEGAVRFHLVSGAATPTKRSPVAVLARTRLAAARNGYLRLDRGRSGEVQVTATFFEGCGVVRRVRVTLS